jgi:hypothetical protein
MLMPAAGVSRREPDARVVLIAVWLIAAAYLWWLLPLGWIPHDDGGLAQAADWVNHGLLPHRDFIEIYTGGLTKMHALAFRLFGTRLFSLRLVLFAVFAAWVPAVFYIASRVSRPLVAGMVTLLAVVWSVPNYPASMPSWYNLFLACFGVAALFRFIDTQRLRWLFVAGLAGGLSILVKVIGLYYVGGALLFLVFETQGSDAGSTASGSGRSAPGYRIFVTACLAAFVVALGLLIRRALRPGEFVQFVVPGATVAAYIVYCEWRTRTGGSARRFRLLVQRLAPFLAGVALPVIVFVIPYVATSSIDALIHGVFTLPMQRMAFATQPAIRVRALWPLLAIAAWVAAARYVPERHRRTALFGIGAILAGLLIASGSWSPAYRLVWNAARGLIPVMVVAISALLASRGAADDTPPNMRKRLMALVSVTAVCTLVQFPYASSIYLYYITPLIALTALACMNYANVRHHAAAGMVAVFLIGFSVLRNNLADTVYTGVEYRPIGALTMLDGERGGVAIPVAHSAIYDPLIARLKVVAKNGPTWAYPDVPEIYFLSGLPSLSRSPYEFFDPPETTEAHILRGIDSLHVSAIVVSTNPPFTPPISESVYKELAHRFPLAQVFGPFVLLWRP